MRHIALFLLLTTLASAMPLRKGASLGYHVWRGWEKDTCHVTLTVADSVATDSGVLWNVAIRDSLIGGDRIRNTQAVLRVVRGDTIWQTPSCLAAWDPASRKVDTVSWEAATYSDTARYDYPYPYGAIGVACQNRSPDNTEPTQIEYKLNRYDLRDSTRAWHVWMSPKIMQNSLPIVEMRPDTGMVKLEEKAMSERWNLVSIDGRNLGPRYDWPPPDTTPLGVHIVELTPGKTWAWRDSGHGSGSSGGARAFRTFDYVKNYRVVILSAQTDSGDWRRCEIQLRSVDSMHYFATGLFQESWNDQSNVDTFPLRVNRRVGEVLLVGGSFQLQLFASGLLQLNPDLPRGNDLLFRSYNDSSYDWFTGSIITSRTSYSMSIRKGLGAVSINYADSWSSQPGESISSSSNIRGVMVLLSMDALVLSNGEYRLGISSRRDGPPLSGRLASLMDLEQEMSMRPGATVRLTSLSGRSNIYSGAEALRVLRSKHGIVMLELRDGNVSIPGRMLLP